MLCREDAICEFLPHTCDDKNADMSRARDSRSYRYYVVLSSQNWNTLVPCQLLFPELPVPLRSISPCGGRVWNDTGLLLYTRTGFSRYTLEEDWLLDFCHIRQKSNTQFFSSAVAANLKWTTTSCLSFSTKKPLAERFWLLSSNRFAVMNLRWVLACSIQMHCSLDRAKTRT